MKSQFGAPYVGITDFTIFEQVRAMALAFNDYKHHESNRRLHVGVMMSRKTLMGESSRYTKVFPPKESIAEIFGSDDTINCLHYADYGCDSHLFSNLIKAIRFGGTGIHALQLDMTWPNPVTIASAVHSSGKAIEIILQIGRDAMIEIEQNPNELVRRLASYGDVIHRVLLDVSMGSGILLNPGSTLRLMRVIRHELPNLKMVVAGGLGPNTVGIIKPIVEEFPDVSIDAQSRLRPSGSNLDPIDWNMASTYLYEALGILK